MTQSSFQSLKQRFRRCIVLKVDNVGCVLTTTLASPFYVLTRYVTTSLTRWCRVGGTFSKEKRDA